MLESKNEKISIKVEENNNSKKSNLDKLLIRTKVENISIKSLVDKFSLNTQPGTNGEKLTLITNEVPKPSKPKVVVPKKLIGAILRKARIEKKLSQSDACEQLNLSKPIIVALEKDEPLDDVLMTYKRGYQRAYIRLLELDEEKLLGKSMNFMPKSGDLSNLHVIHESPGFSHKHIGWFISLLLMLIITMLGFFLWNNFQKSDDYVAQIQTNKTIDGVVSYFDEKLQNRESQNKSTKKQLAEVGGDSNEINKTSSNIKTTTKTIQLAQNNKSSANQKSKQNQANQIIANGINPQAVTFISNGESWLSIVDANGKRLYRNILKLDRVKITGLLPFQVSTGNVQSLRIERANGQQRKIDIFSNDKIVARFTVNRAKSGELIFLPN